MGFNHRTKNKTLMEDLKKNKWISNTSFWKEFIELEISQEKKKFEENSEFILNGI